MLQRNNNTHAAKEEEAVKIATITVKEETGCFVPVV